jgi:hypothetical protein
MPDLEFQVTGVDASVRSVTPSLGFRVRIINLPVDEKIEAVLLNAQIQLQPAQRKYDEREQKKLVELFGAPENWGQTLRNRLWTNSSVTVNGFSGETETILPVACTYDLNLAATKYFYALDGDDVSLLFLFSGSVFYRTADGRLQVTRISWNKECSYRMPAQSWHEVMERHYPNTAWVTEARLQQVSVEGVSLQAGDRVRLRPKARADVMNLALNGQTAVIEAIDQDLEKRIHLAVVVDNDPGRDLGMLRQPGHRFFYGLDEVEPLKEVAP